MGSLFTALAGFLEARSSQGEWRLRIDDVDSLRNVTDAPARILRSLEIHGLHWDGEAVYQSANLDSYRCAVAELDALGLLFPCTCPRKLLAASGNGRYTGRCRHAGLDRRRPHALRLRVESADMIVTDRLQGEFRQNIEEAVGDFIVRRRDGIFGYHLATVIDDHQAGITDVLRGIDLLDSTPRQILLQRLLGLPSPSYTHVPVIVDGHGVKLSKQTGAPPVDDSSPSANLFTLLQWLKQSPPAELFFESPETILAWSVAAWNINKLAGKDEAVTGDNKLESSPKR